MTWRLALFVGALLALACLAVGFTLDRSAMSVSTLGETRSAGWGSPFAREIDVRLPNVRRDDGGLVLGSPFVSGEISEDEAEQLLRYETGGDAGLWYFAAGAIAVLT